MFARDVGRKPPWLADELKVWHSLQVSPFERFFEDCSQVPQALIHRSRRNYGPFSPRGYQGSAFGKISGPSTILPPATTASCASSPNSGLARSCPSAAWSAAPARKRRSISAPERR